MKNVIVDDKNEFIFRFRIPQGHQRLERSLDEYYRMQVLDLARILQFHFRGRPVDIDGFSFRNEPDRVIELLTPADPDVADGAAPQKADAEGVGS